MDTVHDASITTTAEDVTNNLNNDNKIDVIDDGKNMDNNDNNDIKYDENPTDLEIWMDAISN